jgi:hypothetical protein
MQIMKHVESEDSAALPSPQKCPNCSELLKALNHIRTLQAYLHGGVHSGAIDKIGQIANAAIEKAKGETS